MLMILARLLLARVLSAVVARRHGGLSLWLLYAVLSIFVIYVSFSPANSDSAL